MNRNTLVKISAYYLIVVPFLIVAGLTFLSFFGDTTNKGVGISDKSGALVALLVSGPILILKLLAAILVLIKKRIGWLISLTFLGLESLIIIYNLIANNSLSEIVYIYLIINVVLICVLIFNRKDFN